MPHRFHLSNHVENHEQWLQKLPGVHRGKIDNLNNDFVSRSQSKETFLGNVPADVKFSNPSKKATRIESQYHARLAKLFLWKLEHAEDIDKYISEIKESAFRQIKNKDFMEISKGLKSPEKQEAIRIALARRGR